MLRVAFAGAVDSGKSTLLGRLLLAAGAVTEDRLADVGPDRLAWLADGLRAEREGGRTIDVAHRYLTVAGRRVVIADCPGHAEYAQAVFTGMSEADAVVIVVDAERGVTPLTRWHARMAAALRPHLVIAAVNKMDLVGWSPGVFSRIMVDILRVFDGTGQHVEGIPLSASDGGNVVQARPGHWHNCGTTLAQTITAVTVPEPAGPFRMPVQYVDQASGAAYGTVVGGSVRPGDLVLNTASGHTAAVTEVTSGGEPTGQGFRGQAVRVLLSGPGQLATRGDLLADPMLPPLPVTSADGVACWLGADPRAAAGDYTRVLIRAGSACVEGALLGDTRPGALCGGTLMPGAPLYMDRYAENRATGRALLADPDTGQTVGAFMVG